MMHFFKKETKEDKERKKQERKSKDTSLINSGSSQTTTTNSSLSSKQLAKDSELNNENLNTNDHPYSNKINNNNESNLNQDLNNSPTNKIIMSNIKSSSQSQTSSKSSIDSNATTPSIITNNSSSSTPQLLPKPKKGILKTMSKFGIGPTLSTITQSPSSSTSNPQTGSNNQLINSSTNIAIVSSPKLSKFNSLDSNSVTRNNSNKTIESSISNYSKRNSQVLIHDLNETSSSSVIHQANKKNNGDQLNNNANFLLPSLRNLPVYLSDVHQIKFDNSQFIRTINIQGDLMDKLELLQLEEDESEEDLSSYIFITCESSYNIDFLPGDQLIAINGQSILGKSLKDAKCLLEQNHVADSATLIPIQVRTLLKCSELFTRNICDGVYYAKTASPNLEKNQINNTSLNSHSTSSISSSSSSLTTPSSDETDSDAVWLVHTNGYSYVKIVSKISSNEQSSNEFDSLCIGSSVKFRVKLENGNVIEVNEENLEKINPSPQFDFCEDLSRLRFINESSLIHAIRQRYHTLKLIHTNIGSNCLLILKSSSTLNINTNGLELLASNPTSVYNDRVILKFKGKKLDDMPPHIYSYTQNVYRNMLSTRQDQTIILMGHSGSSKTFNSKLILNYLFKIATPSSLNKTVSTQNFSEIKLNAFYCLMNAFCCVSTDKNLNGANRFINIFLLEFNHSGQLASILLQLIALDYTRLIYQPNNESNFLIFYYLLYGADFATKSDLQINNISIGKKAANLLFQSDTDAKITGEKCKDSFQKVLESFKLLNFSDNEIKSVTSILAAIIHLSRADAIKVQSSSINSSATRVGQFLNPNEAHKAANLLGITFQQLNDSVFSILNNSSQNNNNNQSKYSHLSNNGSARISPDANANLYLEPVECLQGFCIGLYQECLNLIVNFVNRAFKPMSTSNIFNYQQPIANSMLIIDPPGFQYHPVNSNIKTQPASYSDLMCNYLSERLQLMFYQINFINPIEKCAQEGLDIDLVEHIPESPSALVNWFDKPASILSQRNSPVQLNKCGLLGLLEEQINSESKSPKNFLRKLIDSDEKQNFLSTNSIEESDSNFTIHHQFGLFPVEYNLDSWLEFHCKDYPTYRNALTILNESKKEIISTSIKQSLALSNAAATFNNTSINLNAFSSATNDSNQPAASSLKRQASVRKMLTMSKRKSFKVNFKLQLDSIFDSMRRTKCNFVFCVLPVQNIQNQHHQQHSLMLSEKLDVPLLRSQLKAHQILAACRIYRQGYPEHLNFEEFERRFSIFLVHNSNDSLQNQNYSINDDHKQACINLIKIFDLDPAFYKFGTTQIFFKAGILNKLNDKRDEKLNDLIIKLQANCRRYLAIKTIEKRKIQDSAVKCIQKNIRISFCLKKWKWWKLYTQLMPIINVQNNETLFKQCKEELDEIKRKNERLMNEKNELKLLNNQLENKLMNLQTEYVEEHATNAGTLDLLEVETSERMRLERELNEIRPAYNESLKKLENLETEMLELRLFNTKKTIEHELEKDDIDGLSTTMIGSENVLSIQIEKIKRENEILRQKLQQDKESTQIFNQSERNFFELKLKEKDGEILEMEKQVVLHKRKYQKLCEDMQDVQRLCDESKVRNRELEKIQIKFDSEMSLLRNKYEKEKDLREKCERERDSSKYEIFGLKSDLDTQKLETSYHAEKCERLERDLKEYESISLNSNNNSNNNNSSFQSNDQFMRMKSQIRDMESKLKDQEEELDDQQGTIQQLEQTKLRLEMQFEKEKQKFQRELAEKDSEMDDLRFHTQKKIKAIEMQLEEESELSNNLQREKREIERKLREFTVNNNGKKGSFVMNGLMSNGNGHNNDLYEFVNKLKRNMNKYKTLAIDAQTQLEKLGENLPKQSIIKALKLQLEDSEINKANALKTKQLLQVEISDLQQQLDDLNFSKQNLEEQNIHLNRELNNLKSQLEEQERDADESLKKYQNHIQNYSLDSHRFIDLNNQIDLITIENRILKEKIREMEEKVNYYENAYVDKSVLNKIESKLRDLECKLDLETTHKTRLQNQLERVKQQNEKLIFEIDTLSVREKKCEEMLKRSQRQYKDTLEEFGDIRKKLIDLEETKKRLEQQNEILERELDSARGELKINQNRLDAFQNAFNSMNNEDDSEQSYEDDDEYDEEEEQYDENYDDNETNFTITKKNNINGGDNRLNLSVNNTVNGNKK